MVGYFQRFILTFVHAADALLSPLGYYAALLLAIAFMIGAVILIGRVLATVYAGNLIRKILVILIAFPLAIIAVLIVWRLFRFAAVYIGNSPWPWSMLI